MFVIRQAEKKDLFQIRKLIKEVGLRDRGIEQHLQHFFIAEIPSQNKGEVSPMVGVVGMEVYPPYGLIRSFVLERAPWNSKVGVDMIRELLLYAEKMGLSRIYLLAGQSTRFFTQLGFVKMDQKEIPELLHQSEHLLKSMSQGQPMVYHFKKQPLPH
ncbi:MAG: GNAT family N-acetyltransferase [Thermoactinomyces sp.]